jgi:hypothetical protein
MAQRNKMSGRVLDAQSKQPIHFANVFFANTSIGNITKEDGTFLFDGFPDGKYELTVTFVGYHNYQVATNFNELDSVNVEIFLYEMPIYLKEILVQENITDWKRNFENFRRGFLGSTRNSRKCTIVNRKSLHLYYDSAARILFANAKDPIIIDNRALGYRIFFFLNKFEFHSAGELAYTSGIPKFELLEPKSPNEESRWEANRKEAFAGSIMNFIRALGKNQLQQNGFEVRRIFEVPDRATRQQVSLADEETGLTDSVESLKYYLKLKSGREYVDSIAEPPLTGQEIFEKGSNSVITYKGSLEVVFRNELEEQAYNRQIRKNQREHQKSKIHFLEERVTIDNNGSYENARSIMVEGYWGWSERMADLLPYDYEPRQED